MTGRLAENVAHFGRALRRAGLPVGPDSVVEAIRAAEVTGVGARSDLYWTLHSVLVRHRQHRPVFDAVFDMFWRSREGFGELPPEVERARERERPRAGAARAAAAMESISARRRENQDLELDTRATSSAEEVLRRRDFAQMSAEEVAEAKRQIAALRLPDDEIATRRFQASARIRRFDARRTLRQSLRAGGKLILPRFKEPRETRPPLVAILDISGSMSQYSRILLHFLHTLSRQRRVHTFVFGTRLTNISRALRMKDPDEALSAASDLVADWSGGTRIATAIDAFNRRWSRRVLGQGAVVLLMTDGLERDDTHDLGAAMDRLHRSCRRLVWLNPLLRFDGFEAKAGGIRAMLPHVDVFRAIHSLETMEELCASLSAPVERVDPTRWLPAA